MRRIFAGLALMIGFAGVAALTPLLATIGAGLTLTVATLGYSVWRRMRRRAGQPGARRPDRAPGAA